jgi:superfamily II DNA/RNA helicase
VLPELIRAVSELNPPWELPKPVQVEAIPLILGGGDVLVSAETGSGKTGAVNYFFFDKLYIYIYIL